MHEEAPQHLHLKSANMFVHNIEDVLYVQEKTFHQEHHFQVTKTQGIDNHTRPCPGMSVLIHWQEFLWDLKALTVQISKLAATTSESD